METYLFDNHNLVTSDALTLDEGNGTSSTATTSYAYQDDIGPYSNGEPSRAKVTLVTNPDGSWSAIPTTVPRAG